MPDRKLSAKVDRLSTELAQMRALLIARQPEAPLEDAEAPTPPTPPMPLLVPEDRPIAEAQDLDYDTLSLAASATQFRGDDEEGEVDGGSQASEPGSYSSTQTAQTGAECSSMRAVMHMALELQGLATPQETGKPSRFFKRVPAATAFTIPPSDDYLRELHTCWSDSKACSRLSADGRTLATMDGAEDVGLKCMPAIEPCIVSLVVDPEEALRENARCPRTQHRGTDDLLTRAYDSGAKAGRLGNSLSHLMLALSTSLQGGNTGAGSADPSTLCDASLEAFGLTTRELGRMMSILVHSRPDAKSGSHRLT